MKSLFQIIVVCTLAACTSKYATQQLPNDSNGKPMLLGKQKITSLTNSPFNEWYQKNHDAYLPNDTIAVQMRSLLQGKKMQIFLGTWCGDSKREVPRMMKLLEHYGTSQSQVELIMVDNHDSVYKQSPAHEERGLNIHRVPTFIVYDGNKELGRIVETPLQTLEKDLFNILNGNAYTPKYKGVIFMENLFKIMSPDSVMQQQTLMADLVKPMLRSASELNTYGYVAMAAKELKKAESIFKLNLAIYPANANLFDSMGEYYFNTGNIALARENYEKALQLDPKLESAKKMLEKTK